MTLLTAMGTPHRGLNTIVSTLIWLCFLLVSLHPASAAAAALGNNQSLTFLQISLPLQNEDTIEAQLMAVATPGSPRYGQHLSADQVQSMFGPSPQSVSAVSGWLATHGITHYELKANSIWVQADTVQAEVLLRSADPLLPKSLVKHVHSISSPLLSTLPPATQKRNSVLDFSTNSFQRRAATNDECNTSISYLNFTVPVYRPSCLRSVYNIGDYAPLASSGSRIAFASFLNISSSFDDINAFQRKFAYPVRNPNVVLVNPKQGATAPQPPTPDTDVAEANLDSQAIISLVQDLPLTEFVTAGSPPIQPDPTTMPPLNTNEPFDVLLEHLLLTDARSLPQVLSMSYSDLEHTVPPKYAQRVCSLIGLLGLRGVSVLVASGDKGVGSSCLGANGQPQFNALFPASCPWVTAVGATDKGLASNNASAPAPLSVWSGSSGGFSHYFSAPSYQRDAVTNGYVAKKVSAETKSYYGQYTNFRGRGFPDVAAHGYSPFFTSIVRGTLTPNYGTSASSPIFASLVALLNDARLRAGKPVLGFLNPLIYAYGSRVFTDVTRGSTSGCNGVDAQSEEQLSGAAIIPGAHWNATEGWDPATGFGVPDFGKLKALVLGL